ncbi:MAG: dTMP kinase [Patescibacteria group bacterium]
MDLKVKKLHPDAIVPEFAHHNDAGMDLFSIENCVLKPNEVLSIKTGLAIEIPDDHVALIWDKSGLATKHSIKTMGGVMDAGYRGEYHVSLLNLGQEDYIIEKGDKVAQLLVQKIEHPNIQIVEELSASDRGMNGFGSTGKKHTAKECSQKGLFIAFEGLDGSGSTTQVDLLAKNLRGNGLTVSTTKEPTNNLIGGLIRGVLTKEWTIPAEGFQLLYAADRSHHLKHTIIPNLDKGDVVITDRYLFSSIAFGSIGADIEWLREINKHFILPDITFFIKVPPEVCIDRIGKSRDGFELFEEEKKLEKTLATYELLAKDESNRFVIIDGEKEIGDIEKEIYNIVTSKLNIDTEQQHLDQADQTLRW